MATIKFFTRSKGDALLPVYLRYIDGRDIDIWMPTPYRMLPDYWNTKTQTFKRKVLYNDIFTEKDALAIETKFAQLRETILKEHFNLGTAVTKEWLKGVIDKFYYDVAAGTESLNDYIDRFVKEATSGQRLCFSGNTKKNYSAGTLRNLRDFQNSFDLYQGIYKETKRKKKIEEPKRPYKPLDWQDITIDWYNEWLAYFYERNCGANYIGKHIKTFKAMLRQAREEGLPVNNEVERKAFKVLSEQVDAIYLTDTEVKKLFALDLSKLPLVKIARDVFLVGVYTAQRYSDYSRITKDNIRTYSGNKVIELIQKKTGEKCIIPIRPELEEILSRYDYTLPKTFEQKINDRIKIAGKEAGITEVIHYEKNKGGLIVKQKAAKHQLIKTHTARRTGCTLMYLAGIPVIDIMKVSGHKTEKEFLKYVRVTKEQTAVNLASHPYFANANLKVVAG
jgi:Phage integrase family/Phage integrase SAM-like domain